jgi:hypothetical protein
MPCKVLSDSSPNRTASAPSMMPVTHISHEQSTLRVGSLYVLLRLCPSAAFCILYFNPKYRFLKLKTVCILLANTEFHWQAFSNMIEISTGLSGRLRDQQFGSTYHLKAGYRQQFHHVFLRRSHSKVSLIEYYYIVVDDLR